MCVCVCVINNSYSQSDPWKIDGNTVDTAAYIGTTNARALRFYTNNVEFMRITPNGRLGIGTTDPSERLQVTGNINLSGDLIFSKYANRGSNEPVLVSLDSNGRTMSMNRNQIMTMAFTLDCFQLVDGNGNTIAPAPSWASASGTNYGKIFTGIGCPAWVGIGTNNPLAHLHIKNQSSSADLKLLLIEGKLGGSSIVPIFQITSNGITRAREIIVDLETWPDYVFRPSYRLMPLRDLRLYINTYGHLPNVPPAAEIEQSGLSLNENARITMEKIEELTLYVLDLQEQIDVQNTVIEQQMELLRQMQALLEMYMGEAAQPQAPSGNQ